MLSPSSTAEGSNPMDTQDPIRLTTAQRVAVSAVATLLLMAALMLAFA